MDYNISFRKSLLHQSPDPDSVDSSDTRGIHIGRAVTNLKKMGLDIVEVGVKHQVKIGLVGHLGNKLILVHHLADVKRLLTKDLAQLLPPAQPLRLIGQTDHLQPYRPDLPGNVLWRKRPPCSFSLEKLQRNLS